MNNHKGYWTGRREEEMLMVTRRNIIIELLLGAFINLS